MRRIVVLEREGSWHVASNDGEHEPAHASILDAAKAAQAYGETLRGSTALGYVIRLLAPQFTTGSDPGITLHTCVF